jgi:hypothetical protein
MMFWDCNFTEQQRMFSPRNVIARASCNELKLR